MRHFPSFISECINGMNFIKIVPSKMMLKARYFGMTVPVSCYQLVSIKVKVQVMCREYDQSCNSTSKAESELLVIL